MESEITKLAETFDKVMTLKSEEDATVKKSPSSQPRRKVESKPENSAISKKIRQRRFLRIPKISKDILLERLDPSAFQEAGETQTEHTGAIEAATEDTDSEADSSYESEDVFNFNEGVVSYRNKPRALRRIKVAIKKKEEERKQELVGAPPRPPTPPTLFTKPLELNEDDLKYLESKSKAPADNKNVIRQTTEEYQRNRKMMIDMNREKAEARRQRAISRKARSKRSHDESEVTL